MVIGSNLVATVGPGSLVGEVAFQLGISEKDAVDEEREVRAERKNLLPIVPERISPTVKHFGWQIIDGVCLLFPSPHAA